MILLIFIILLIIYIINKRNYVYDLYKDRMVNYFEIYDIKNMKKQISTFPKKTIIDDKLPEHIKINKFSEKGWGLVTNKYFSKNDIVYEAPIYNFPVDGIEILSNNFGSKIIEKDIHCGDVAKLHNLFTGYDCFLNHSDNPNTYHSDLFLIRNKSIYVVLKALRNIHPGDELTINYIYLNKYIYYINSYISYLVSKLLY